MIRSLSIPCVAASAFLVAGTASAQTAAKMGVSDGLFAVTAADGGMTEVIISEIAAKKATDPELKKFSERMIAEHTKVNNELKALAARKGISLPQVVSAGHQFCGQSLEGLSGADFDCAYSKAQLLVHESSVAAFEAEAERGQDPEVRAFAARTLPHIKEHTKTIKPIALQYEKKKIEKEEKGEK